MAAATYDTTIEQGADWAIGLALTKNNGRPLPLDGYTAEGQIRTEHNDPVVLADIIIDFDENRKTGKLTFSLPKEVTKTFTFSKAVYDIKLTDSFGRTKRLIQGKITLSPEVTKDAVVTP